MTSLVELKRHIVIEHLIKVVADHARLDKGGSEKGTQIDQFRKFL